jgi:hypothetical protein
MVGLAIYLDICEPVKSNDAVAIGWLRRSRARRCAFPAIGPGRSSSALRCGSCLWAARS